MDWEIINGVTGIISAIGTVSSLSYFSNNSSEPVQTKRLISMHQLMSYILVCSGWILLCFAALFVFEPYGYNLSDSEYQNFFGYIISLPSIILFGFSIKIMMGKADTK